MADLDGLLPAIDMVLIEIDSDIPFTVTRIELGQVFGTTPAGKEIHFPMENLLHEIDQYDL